MGKSILPLNQQELFNAGKGWCCFPLGGLFSSVLTRHGYCDHFTTDRGQSLQSRNRAKCQRSHFFSGAKTKVRSSPKFKRLRQTQKPCSYHPKLLQKARLWTSSLSTYPCGTVEVEPQKKLRLRFKQNWTRPGNWCSRNWLLAYLGASHTVPLPTWQAARQMQCLLQTTASQGILPWLTQDNSIPLETKPDLREAC